MGNWQWWWGCNDEGPQRKNGGKWEEMGLVHHSPSLFA
jgi:hypothetical protein